MFSHAILPPLLSLAALGRSSSSPGVPAIAQAFTHLAQPLDPDATPAGQAAVVQLAYDAVGEEPPLLGDQSGLNIE